MMPRAAQRISCPFQRHLRIFHALRTVGSHRLDAWLTSLVGQARRRVIDIHFDAVRDRRADWAVMTGEQFSSTSAMAERAQIVASLIRPALAEQRRICLFACDDFPNENDHLGRDLSLVTVVDSDAARAQALRDHFGQMIVVETSEPDTFLEAQARLGEYFDLIIVPDLDNALTNDGLAALIASLNRCLQRGGRIALIAAQPTKLGGGRSFGDLANAVATCAPGFQLSGRTAAELLLVELEKLG
jgi:hypothetical protein